jgi:hypothetical protein
MNEVLKQTAVALAMAGAGAVDAKAPAAKAGKIVRTFTMDNGWTGGESALTERIASAITKLEGVLSERQINVVQDMACDAFDRQREEDRWDVVMDAHVAALHGDQVLHEVYREVARSFGIIFGTYPAKCYRKAIVRAFGKIPTANDPRAKGGVKGLNPKKWMQGIDTRIASLIEATGKRPSGDIDGDILRDFVAAVKALEAVRVKLRKRIAA